MEQYKPLKGVKVVELSLMVASASCGRDVYKRQGILHMDT